MAEMNAPKNLRKFLGTTGKTYTTFIFFWTEYPGCRSILKKDVKEQSKK